MNQYIDEIQASLKNYTPLNGDLKSYLSTALSALDSRPWKSNYPVALVHNKSRIENSEEVDVLEKGNLFDTQGDTPVSWNKDQLDFLAKNSTKTIQNASYVALKEEDSEHVLFLNKRAKDYWKKIASNENIATILELTSYNPQDEICKIEFNFREIIRKRKEVPSLKDVGFIWMCEVDESRDLKKLLKHYFLDDFRKITQHNRMYYIGWNAKLRDLSMRHFVCPPQG